MSRKLHTENSNRDKLKFKGYQVDTEQLLYLPTHRLERERVLLSHLKYMRFMKEGGSLTDFKCLINYFILGPRAKSRGYCLNVVHTLVRMLRQKNSSYQRPFHDGLITRAYYRAKKLAQIMHSLPPDKQILYTNNGEPLDISTIQIPTIVERQKHLPLVKAQQLYNYAETYLKGFLRNPESKYILEVELHLLLVLLYHLGLRTNELLKLTINQVNDLIIKQETHIPSKTGMINICVPMLIATILDQFLLHPSRPTYHQTLFIFSYQKLRRANINLCMQLFGYRPPGQLFHSWRLLFSARANAINPLLAQNAMSHTRWNMTKRYINNQMLNDTDLKKVLLEQLTNNSSLAMEK